MRLNGESAAAASRLFWGPDIAKDVEALEEIVASQVQTLLYSH